MSFIKKGRGIILKRIKYKDSDFILNILLESGISIGLYARGAANSKRRFPGGVLEPLNLVEIVYKENNKEDSGLHELREADLLNSFRDLRKDYDRIEMGLEFSKVIDEVSTEAGEENENLFRLFGNTLKVLGSSKDLDLLKLMFYAKFLYFQGILEPTNEIKKLLSHSISNHERVEISREDLVRIQSYLIRVFEDYKY